MAPAWKPQHKSQWNDWSQWNEGSKWNGRSQWDERPQRTERPQWNERSQWNEKSEWYGYSSRTWKSESAEDSSKGVDEDATGLSEEELLVAVQACYHQEVYPQDVLLLWMLKGYKKVSLEEIQRVAEASCGLQVEYSATTKKGFAVLMEMPPLGFSGFADDAAEHVPPSLVEEAGMMVLLGGWPSPEQTNHDRISIAAWLHSSEVLQHLTLGKCLALVNMLLASHSVLGKRAGRLVPYFQSEEYEKQENARRRCPTGLREDEVWVSCWEDFIGYLKVLLEEHGGKMMSARLKNEMRARFNLEFSETALGHVSLGNLLDDPRFLEHFHVRKSPPAADLILLKDYKPWKEPTAVPEPQGAWLWSLSGDEKRKRCSQELLSTGPWRQEVLLPLPCAPWEIVSEICRAPTQSFAVEEV